MTDTDDLPSPEALRALIDYCPVSGRLTWRPRDAETLEAHGWPAHGDIGHWNARNAGSAVKLARHCADYRSVRLFGRRYSAPRLAWTLHHGAWPVGNVWLRNRDSTDLRLANLRVPPRPQARRINGLRANNHSGRTGVHWRRSKAVWRAQINVNGERIDLGEYRRFADAVRARKEAEARFGRSAGRSQ